MFIWLASYPKSGNTFTRALIASYFFSKDGNFNFSLIKNILQFPDLGLFRRLGVDVKNEKEVIKNYVKVQESINVKNSVQFFKTHSYLFNIENNPFTDLNNSLGVVYIVRDPRNVVLSASHHNQKSHEKTVDDLINGHVLGRNDGTRPTVYSGSWSGNFNSWKSFKSVNKYLLVKYEDLIHDKEKTFHEILKFIFMLQKVDFVLDKKKFQNSLDSTDFKNMKKLENEQGFDESVVDKKTGKKKNFFHLGAKTDWKTSLDINLQNKLQKVFEKEMTEIGYL